ncbi:MAG TPA: DinB family protein [Bryobacteraceae bacterium]|nr:DinB family protein [Bryobacteraceae bacterium]
MATRQNKIHNQMGRTAVQMFAANDRMNQLLIEQLDPAAWKAKPPGKVRSIAAIFTHMHNVRTKWVRLTAPHLKVPAQLNRSRCTARQARAGLAESAARCAEMLAEALGDSKGRIQKFHRDGWAPSWPVGLEMLCYMLAHEAHHRGQVCMLAHQLGFTLPHQVGDGIWNWEKLWKECGAPGGPGFSEVASVAPAHRAPTGSDNQRRRTGPRIRR